jgi:hypothetical protein
MFVSSHGFGQKEASAPGYFYPGSGALLLLLLLLPVYVCALCVRVRLCACVCVLVCVVCVVCVCHGTRVLASSLLELLRAGRTVGIEALASAIPGDHAAHVLVGAGGDDAASHLSADGSNDGDGDVIPLFEVCGGARRWVGLRALL